MRSAHADIGHGRRTFSLVFGAYCLLMFLAFVAVLLANGEHLAVLMGPSRAAIALIALVTGILGSVLTYYRPGNAIGPIFVIIALLAQSVYLKAFAAARLIAGSEPSFALLLAYYAWPWVSAILGLFLAFVILLFPDGRLPSRRWRPAAWLFALALADGVVLIAIQAVALFRQPAPVALSDLDLPTDSGLPGGTGAAATTLLLEPRLAPLVLFVAVAAAALMGIGALAMIVRYRRGDAVLRRQIRVVLPPMILFALFQVTFFAPVTLFPAPVYTALLPLLSFLAALIPVAIGIAILHYRLYDIDFIINRTLVYGLLTAVLAVIYLGMVLVTQAVFVRVTGQESPLALVISTLVIAALFNPLRGRIQAFIDRRFYRQRYDAAQTLQQFALGARDEVEMEKLAALLMETVEGTVQPESAVLWLRPGDEV